MMILRIYKCHVMRRDAGRDLIGSVVSGEAEAYKQIVLQYYEDIFYYVLKQVGDEELTKELVQDVFVKAYESLSRFDETKASFRTWLYRIASARCVDYYRSRQFQLKKLTCYLPIKEEVVSVNILETLMKQEQLELIKEVMPNVLSAKYERVMRYHFFADLEISEIAAIENMPVKSVYTIIPRSIKKLKQEMEGLV